MNIKKYILFEKVCFKVRYVVNNCIIFYYVYMYFISYKRVSVIVKFFDIGIGTTFLLNGNIRKVCVLKKREKSPLQISSIQFNKPV